MSGLIKTDGIVPRLFATMRELADADGNASVSFRHLAARLGNEERGVRRAMERLVERGVVERLGQRANQNMPSRYRVTPLRSFGAPETPKPDLSQNVLERPRESIRPPDNPVRLVAPGTYPARGFRLGAGA